MNTFRVHFVAGMYLLGAAIGAGLGAGVDKLADKFNLWGKRTVGDFYDRYR